MAIGQLSSREFLGLNILLGICATIVYRALQSNAEPILTSIGLSGVAFAATYSLIVWTAPSFLRVGLKGTDMSKRTKKEIPECAGALCAVVYLLIVTAFIPFAFYKDIVAATSGGGNRDVVQQVEHVNQGRFLHKFPHSKVSKLSCPPVPGTSPRPQHADVRL